GEVGLFAVGLWRRIVGGPVIRAAAGVRAFDERLAIARDAHWHNLDRRLSLAGDRGNVQVVKLRLGAFLREDLLDDACGDLSGAAEVGVLVIFERAGDAGDAEERPFDRGSDGA